MVNLFVSEFSTNRVLGEDVTWTPRRTAVTPVIYHGPQCTLKDAGREHIIQALAATNWVIGGPKGAASRAASHHVNRQDDKTRHHAHSSVKLIALFPPV